MSPSVGPISRRTALGIGAGAAAATLAACSAGGSGGPAGKRVNTDRAQELTLPKYVAPPVVPGGISSKVDGVPVMYKKPIENYTTSVKSPPGNGDQVSTFQMLWTAPPRPRGKNPFWQEIEKRLNITYDPTLASSDNYNDKLATALASGDIPDIVFVQDTTAVGAQAIHDGVFADLSEVLAGDGIMQWPNLANIRGETWKASAKNGHIVGIPNENTEVNNFPAIRSDALDAAGYRQLPKDADEFAAALADIAKLGTLHGKQIWPIGAYTSLIQSMFSWMFKISSDWMIQDGKLVNQIETDEFADLMGYLNKLWKSHVFHPDALALGQQTQKVNDMYRNGQIILMMDAFSGYFSSGKITDCVTNTKGGAKVEFFVPPAKGGGDPVVGADSGYFGIAAIPAKVAKDDKKLTELLGVINYWRSPYGSKENLFLGNGIEGLNYKFGNNHEIVSLNNDAAGNDLGALQYLGPSNTRVFNIPTDSLPYADQFYSQFEKLMSLVKTSPVLGVYSKTAITASSKLADLSTNYRNGIVSGRMPLTKINEYRQKWKDAGGDTIRQEYQRALDNR